MSELAVVYAALILHDGGAEINEENLKTLVEAAHTHQHVEAYWYSKFAELLATQDINTVLTTISAGAAPAAGAGGAAAAAGGAAEPEKEATPEPSSEEEDVDMGGLYDDEDDF
eukprot:Awhi_evm1s15334